MWRYCLQPPPAGQKTSCELYPEQRPGFQATAESPCAFDLTLLPNRQTALNSVEVYLSQIRVELHLPGGYRN
jgi:hypothetical protein